MSAPEPRRPSGAELVAQVATAALHRRETPSEPTFSVKISDDNTKGEVRVTVSGDGPEGIGESVKAEFDRLRAAYPRGNGGTA